MALSMKRRVRVNPVDCLGKVDFLMPRARFVSRLLTYLVAAAPLLIAPTAETQQDPHPLAGVVTTRLVPAKHTFGVGERIEVHVDMCNQTDNWAAFVFPCRPYCDCVYDLPVLLDSDGNVVAEPYRPGSCPWDTFPLIWESGECLRISTDFWDPLYFDPDAQPIPPGRYRVRTSLEETDEQEILSPWFEVRELPVPASSSFGMIVLFLAVATTGFWVLRRTASR